MAAVVWLWGPPWRPGNTARSIALACSAVDISIAPRGPRSVLWVVVEITSAWPTGVGWAPPATSPAMWAMSATSTAPTSAAMEANAGKSMVRGMAVPPQKINFGRSARAIARTSSRSTMPSSRRTPYWTARNHLPVADTFHPWVRCPPAGSAIPITVSPGDASAMYTARLAGEPE